MEHIHAKHPRASKEEFLRLYNQSLEASNVGGKVMEMLDADTSEDLTKRYFISKAINSIRGTVTVNGVTSEKPGHEIFADYGHLIVDTKGKLIGPRITDEVRPSSATAPGALFMSLKDGGDVVEIQLHPDDNTSRVYQPFFEAGSLLRSGKEQTDPLFFRSPIPGMATMATVVYNGKPVQVDISNIPVVAKVVYDDVGELSIPNIKLFALQATKKNPQTLDDYKQLPLVDELHELENDFRQVTTPRQYGTSSTSEKGNTTIDIQGNKIIDPVQLYQMFNFN